jgi:hypothetical protein
MQKLAHEAGGRKPAVDLFGTPSVVGLEIRLDISRREPCCDDVVAQVFPGKGPHAGELICTKCGQHRGWLSKSTHDWLLAVVGKFGWPEEPIIIRDRAAPSKDWP